MGIVYSNISLNIAAKKDSKNPSSFFFVVVVLVESKPSPYTQARSSCCLERKASLDQLLRYGLVRRWAVHCPKLVASMTWRVLAVFAGPSLDAALGNNKHSEGSVDELDGLQAEVRAEVR